ncbi:hypothetical protein [uncultured Hoeflea sp.]|nr:hypothetical protein [uncultured Hoeflea sp.]
MPDLLIELRSEEIPARPLARSGAAVRTGKTGNLHADRAPSLEVT